MLVWVVDNMVKICTYSCHQCRLGIGGFDEFGELRISILEFVRIQPMEFPLELSCLLPALNQHGLHIIP